MSAAPDPFANVVGESLLVQALVGGTIIAALNLLGASLVLGDPSERALDASLGFAGGAMLFVISDEIVPETHSRGYERVATAGLVVGVVVLYLDVSLG